MKKIWILAIILLLLAACSNGTKTPVKTPGSELPTPVVNTTSVPDAAASAQEFFTKWEQNDYAGMYEMLSPTSRDAITQEDFVSKYTSAAQNLSLNKLTVGILSTLIEPTTAKISYQANFATALFGAISRQMQMTMVLNNGVWKVQWEDGLILPELSGGNRLALYVEQPARGDINDRNGNTLATQTEAVALGVWPGQIYSGQEGLLLTMLSEMTNKPKNVIKDMYRDAGADWYVPIGEVSKQGYDDRAATLDTLNGLVTNPYSGRYYFNGGAAPQVLGYELSISPEQLDEYRRLGYAGDEKVGASGLEKWGEKYLAGKPSADLYVIQPDGTNSTRLAHTDPQAALYHHDHPG